MDPSLRCCTSKEVRSHHALLHHGANARARDDQGNTRLHLACRTQDAALVDTAVGLLLRCGLDEKALTKNNSICMRFQRKCWNYPWAFHEIARARLLPARPPSDRAWRRRSWLVMLDSHAPRARTARCDSRGVSGHGSDAEEGRVGSRRSKMMAKSENAGGGESGVVGRGGNGCAVDVGGEDGGWEL